MLNGKRATTILIRSVKQGVAEWYVLELLEKSWDGFCEHTRSRRYFWLVLRAGEASVCPEHPGFPEDVYVTSTPTALYRLVVGQQSLKEAMDEGTVRVEGPPRLVRSLPRWLLLRASGPPVGAASSSR